MLLNNQVISLLAILWLVLIIVVAVWQIVTQLKRPSLGPPGKKNESPYNLADDVPSLEFAGMTSLLIIIMLLSALGFLGWLIYLIFGHFIGGLT